MLSDLKSVLDRPMRDLCRSCAQRMEYCLCEHITKYSTQTKFVILVHPKEYKRESICTGRMTHSSLPNSSFLMGVDFSEDKQVNQYIDDPANHCLLLYPGPEAIETSSIEKTEKNLIIFILDGTWANARKMYNMSKNLQKLQKISINPTAPSLFIIKQQPFEKCLSTLEAVIYVLKDLEKASIEASHDWDQMLKPFTTMIARQIEISNDPTRLSYRGKKCYDLESIQKRAQTGTRRKKRGLV